MITLKTLLKQVDDGRSFGLNWYARAYVDCDTMADKLNVSTELFVYAAAVFSPRVQVSRSINMAIEWLKDPEIKPAGCMANVYNTAMKYRDTLQLNGPKTENFRRSILSAGMDDSLCIDVWACRALGVEQSKAYNVGQYAKIRRLFNRASVKTGLTLPQLQACQWYSSMVKAGRNPNGVNLISQSQLESVGN